MPVSYGSIYSYVKDYKTETKTHWHQVWTRENREITAALISINWLTKSCSRWKLVWRHKSSTTLSKTSPVLFVSGKLYCAPCSGQSKLAPYIGSALSVEYFIFKANFWGVHLTYRSPCSPETMVTVMKHRIFIHSVSLLVFWAKSTRRITSQPKTMFNLSSIYSAASHQTTNYSKTTKSVLYTNLHKTKHTQTSKTKFAKN